MYVLLFPRFLFWDRFTNKGFNLSGWMTIAYWGAEKGCWNAFVLHSFTCWEPFCILLKSIRFNSIWPWICRMALLRKLRGWTTFQRPAGRKQDGRMWHVALLAGWGCLSWPSGCQNRLPLITPDRRGRPGHNRRASWFKSQMLTKTHHDHTLTD